MSVRLQGRRVLITGAGSGIGLATAELFAAQGAQLALLDRDGVSARRAAEATGGHAFEMDVTDEAAVAQVVGQAAQAMGGLDGVVNSAGVMCSEKLESTSLATWNHVIAVNLTGPFLVCRAAIPHLRRCEAATIVTIASAVALLPTIAGGVYAASKAGVAVLTKALAAELAPAIRANAVCPGAADTPMANAALAGLDDAGRAAFAKRYAIGRLSRPDEVASAILFLTSHESSSVTGISLAVDGGRTFH